jgi:hypothetical protein
LEHHAPVRKIPGQHWHIINQHPRDETDAVHANFVQMAAPIVVDDPEVSLTVRRFIPSLKEQTAKQRTQPLPVLAS